MAVCFLSLGSNQGNRAKNLNLALQALRRLPNTRFQRVSRIYESSPVGPPTQKKYLNCCVKIETDISPLGLLVEFKRIEAALGRWPGPRWGPRPMDIDLLFYGKARLRTRHLTVPHPRTLKRKFVLIPLAEIHSTTKAWLRRLNDPSQNVKLYVQSRRTNQ